MYFMYVDESGDPGPYDLTKPAHLRATRHYIVSGFIIPAEEWRNYLTYFLDVRRYIKKKYGLPVRVELHGSELIRPKKSEAIKNVGPRYKRIALYQDALGSLTQGMTRARFINVHLDKQKPVYASSSKRDIQDLVWNRLLQRYSTYLQKSCNGDTGLVFADETNEAKVRGLLRKMRVHNFVPSSIYIGESVSVPVVNIIEDPIMRNSTSSYFVQIADLVAHSLYRKLYPKTSLNKHNIDKLFDRVDPLLCKAASRYNPQGIVNC
jgi:hypothetical protein